MENPSHIWHPFTQMKLADPPIHIVKGEGVWLYAADGKKFIDGISSWWTNIHGHAHPHIAAAIAHQAQTLEHVIFAGFTHTPAERIATRLAENHLPDGLQKIFFSDNGSTSVEVAVKMAVQYWNNIGTPKKKIIAFHHAYHGDTFGSMSVSDRSAFTQPFHDLLFDVVFIDPPFKGLEDKSLAQLKEIVETNDVAAFIYEPLVMGAGGMLMYDATDLKPLLQLARTHNTLLIADEVMTGFYRTGKMFATEYTGVAPDLICLSKGLTGGTMALGITACTNAIYNAFYSEDKMKAFYHGHSFTANPMACATANASLDLVEAPDFQQKIVHIVQQHAAFAARLKQYKSVENIRQTGTIIAWDHFTTDGTQYFNSLRDTLYRYFLQKGILLRPLGNTVYIMPPYCIAESELAIIYDAVEEFLKNN